jgi:hypothetical protein
LDLQYESAIECLGGSKYCARPKLFGNLCRSNPDANRNAVRLLQSAASSIFEVGRWPKAADSAAATCRQLSAYAGRSANADSDDPAEVYRFDLAQDSEMTSPTMPI